VLAFEEPLVDEEPPERDVVVAEGRQQIVSPVAPRTRR
jgi:hypothetical protein